MEESLKTAVPPHNDEAEVATLGGMLIDSESVPIVVAFLKDKDFYQGQHMYLFRAMVAIHERGDVPDLINLSEELRRMGLSDTSDFHFKTEYLARLTSAVPTSANIEFYARIVQAASIRRQWAKWARAWLSDIHDEGLSIDEIRIRHIERVVPAYWKLGTDKA